jgi:hypothetical protein
VVAGHSPDGRVQLFIMGEVAGLIQTTWQTTGDMNDGWFSWETFPGPPGLETFPPTAILGLGQLADGRMQLWTIDQNGVVWTTWKVSREPDAAWTSWTKFNPAMQAGGFVAASNLSDGRLEVWSCAGVGLQGGGYEDTSVVMNCKQILAGHSVAWSAWQNPFIPELAGGAFRFAAGRLSDRRLQLFALNNGPMQSTLQISANANAGWADWEPFVPDPGPVWNVAAGQLADGRLQVWVMTEPGPPDGTTQILTSQKATTNPDSPWTDWVSIGTL